MNAYIKVKLKLIAMNIVFELIVNSIILSVAYLCNKLLITIAFYIPFHYFRYAFPKVYHSKIGNPLMNLIGCIIFSCICYFVAMKLMLPINISIFSSVLVGMLINYTLYKIQDYLDLKQQHNKSLLKLCEMTEEELRNYAISKHLGETLVDTLVLRLKHNYRWCDIQAERGYTKDGIRYHKETLQKILGVKL